MEIKINNHNVVANGTVVSQNDEDIMFSFSEKLNIKIVFSKGMDDTGPKTLWRLENETTLVCNFCGFGAAQGYVSNRDPIEVGTLNGQRLFLNYALSYVGTAENHTRVFQFTFFVIGQSN